MSSPERTSAEMPTTEHNASSSLPARRAQVTLAPLSPAELRAARREALLRRTSAARAAQESSALVPAASEGPPRVEVVLKERACPSWRAEAARQAYLSTIPPAAEGTSFRRVV